MSVLRVRSLELFSELNKPDLFIFVVATTYYNFERSYSQQEAQLMMTNACDEFRGQSRLPNMVLFDMLIMVSY